MLYKPLVTLLSLTQWQAMLLLLRFPAADIGEEHVDVLGELIELRVNSELATMLELVEAILVWRSKSVDNVRVATVDKSREHDVEVGIVR